MQTLGCLAYVASIFSHESPRMTKSEKTEKYIHTWPPQCSWLTEKRGNEGLSVHQILYSIQYNPSKLYEVEKC